MTMGIGSIFMFVNGAKMWIQANSWILWLNFALSIITLIVLMWKRRQYPLNFALLGLFTFFEAFTLGLVVSYVDVNTVLQAVVITFGIFVGLTVFTFQTRWDFTFLAPLLSIGLCSLIMIGLLSWVFPFSSGAQFAYCIIGVIVFVGYILFDTFMIMKRFSPEEYILAAVELYLDIINLFLFILRLLSKK